MKNYKLTLFGVKETTKIIAEYLHQNGVKVDLIVSIDPSLVEKNNISDYTHLKTTATTIGADYYATTDYTLKHLPDDFFKSNTFEIGIVYGWQRLIPPTIMSKFNKGLFGFHASPALLPKGRGRSPLNWGIILGKTALYNHLFRYVADADAGDIYAITKFQITPHDTIITLMYKSLIIAKQQLLPLIHDAYLGKIILTPQQGKPSYFTKRAPEDGLIHFETLTTKSIINLIRGITQPFPGAFCYTDRGQKVMIWEAWAFDSLIDFSNYQAGEVIDNLYQKPIIKTTDGSIILNRYEGVILKPNDQLISFKRPKIE